MRNILLVCLLLAVTVQCFDDFYQCPQIRKQACYRIYKPVCGKVIDKDTKEETYKQYSNDCVACSNQEVEGYLNRPCQNGKKKEKLYDKETLDKVNKDFFSNSGYKNSQKKQDKQQQQKKEPEIVEELEKEYCENMANVRCNRMETDTVCGYFDQTVKCFVPPCASTYPNKCMACTQNTVEYIVKGECPNLLKKSAEEKVDVHTDYAIDFKKIKKMEDGLINFNETQITPEEFKERLKNKKLCPKIKSQDCDMSLEPVCGLFKKNLKCIQEPCGQTFGNSCIACQQSNVEYTVDGPCF